MTRASVERKARRSGDGDRGTAGNGGGVGVVAAQECRDLWVGGRGPALVLAFSVLLSVVTYLTATNRVLNFLEQREAVNLTLQVAVAVGVLVALVVAADAISGERERGTLETLLLAPVSRRAIMGGKLAAALTLWFAAYLVLVPYVWVLGRGVSIVGAALLLGGVVGTLLAGTLAAFGLVISDLARSNKVSLSMSLFVLLALFAPTQLPTGAQRGSVGGFLMRLNPIAAGEHYIGTVLVNGHGWTQDLSYITSPLLAAVVAGAALTVTGSRIELREGRGA